MGPHGFEHPLPVALSRFAAPPATAKFAEVLLKANVAAWLDEPFSGKLAPAALGSPPTVKVAGAVRLALATSTVPVLASVPLIVGLLLPPKLKPGSNSNDRGSTSDLVHAALKVSRAA